MNKVSVIIPYYRSSDTIERTIRSIYNQTNDIYEIIIIDDYSNTLEDNKILNKLEKKSNIKVIKSEINKGPSYCRNLGIQYSTGNYIAFQDSDDAWHPQKIELQIKIMNEKNAYISGHGSRILSNELEIPKSYINFKSLKVKSINKFQQLFKNRFPTRSVVIKNDKKFMFDEDLRRAEDYLMWTNILFGNEKAVFIDEDLAYSFKEHYGASGLTEDIYKMYRSVLLAYYKLYKSKKINMGLFYVLICYQTIKYLYRKVRLIGRK